VVAAAKVDLGDAQQRGDFRDDLYYRLNVVTCSITPLRERRADIPLLFSYFAKKASVRIGMSVPGITAAMSLHLNDHDWPGNVRELGHFAERVVLGLEATAQPAAPAASRDAASGTLSERLDREEASIIREALEKCDGDVAETIA